MANQHFGTKVIERDFTETGVTVINYADVLAEVGLTGTVLDGGHGSMVNNDGDVVFPNTTHPILFSNDDGLHGVNVLVVPVGSISTHSEEYQAMTPDEKLTAWATGRAYDEEPTADEVQADDILFDDDAQRPL